MADRIDRLLNDPTLRRRLGDTARERVRSRNSFAGQSLRYQALFDLLVHAPVMLTEAMAGSAFVVVFWICFAIVGGTYVGYPLLVGAWARLFGRPVRRATVDERRGLSPPETTSDCTGPVGINPTARQIESFTVLLAAHNEENNIERRIAELRRHIASTGLDGELIVLADGCTDRTSRMPWKPSTNPASRRRPRPGTPENARRP